jgi:hypothetical protein
VSLAAYRVRADAICADAKRAASTIPRYHTYAEFVLYVQQVRNITDKHIDEMIALRVPSRIKPTIAQVNRLELQEKASLQAYYHQVTHGVNPRRATATFRTSIGPISAALGGAVAAAGHTDLRCTVIFSPCIQTRPNADCCSRTTSDSAGSAFNRSSHCRSWRTKRA